MVSSHPNQLVKTLLDTLKERKISIVAFAKEIGIPMSRIYKWREEQTNPKSGDEAKIREWLNNKMEKTPNLEKNETVQPDDIPDYSNNYIHLLEKNDEFFKNQYAAFNTQVLVNLTLLLDEQKRLLDGQKRLEALIKINLEHTGTLEAQLLGKDPQEIHDEINKAILSAAGVETDTSYRS